MGVKVDPLFQGSENFLHFKFHSHSSQVEHKEVGKIREADQVASNAEI